MWPVFQKKQTDTALIPEDPNVGISKRGLEATITAIFMKKKKKALWMNEWKVLIRDDFLKK